MAFKVLAFAQMSRVFQSAHVGLRLGMARGFTQYAYGWVQLPADELAEKDLARAKEEQERAGRLYLRARGYGLDGLRLTRGIKIDDRAASGSLRIADPDGIPIELAAT